MNTPVPSTRRGAYGGLHKLELPSLVRRLTIETLYRSGGGHYGASLSVIEILSTLYSEAVRHRRDKVILSKGHAAPALYATFAALGLLKEEQLWTYAREGSSLQGHPDMRLEPLVDFSTGSLGQGLSVGLGMALVLGERGRVWVVLGDGECQEGQIWEAARLAAGLNVVNLAAIIDSNRRQEWNLCRSDVPPVASLRSKWSSFGWNVLECNGHDVTALAEAYRAMSEMRMPTVLIANTVKGHGSHLISSDPNRFHCDQLTTEEYATVLEELS